MSGLRLDRVETEEVPVVDSITGQVGTTVVYKNSSVRAVVVGQGEHLSFRHSAIDPSEMVRVVTPTKGLQTD